MSLGISYFSLFSSCNLARSVFGDASLLIHDLLAQIIGLQCKYAKITHFITTAKGQQIQGTVHFFDPRGCEHEHDLLHFCCLPSQVSPWLYQPLGTSTFCVFQPGTCRPGHSRSRAAEVPLRDPWLPAPVQLLSLTI